MKHTPHLISRLAVFSTVAMALISPTLRAQTASQSVSLVAGWNAVWLEVEPVYDANHPKAGQTKAPADVFPAGVLTVISPKPLAGTAEFFAEDPTNVSSFNQEGWEQWNQPAAPGDSLTAITGNRAYLIKASGSLGFTVQGNVRFHRPTWAPDRYNLIGFGLEGSPSFNDFFGASGTTHPVDRIFRLHPSSGNWVRLSAPLTDTMNSNEAYWIFSSGPSDYMGPVAVAFDHVGSGKLDFGGPSDTEPLVNAPGVQLDLEELVFTNLNAAVGSDATPALDLINPDSDAGSLDLFVVIPTTTPNILGWDQGNQVDSSPGATASPSALGEVVAPQGTKVLTVGASRNWVSGGVGRTNVYRLHTGAGSLFWLPVSAVNNDILQPTDTIPPNPADQVKGLWVGEVSVKNVSSFVENGAPVRPAAAPAPVRLLLHSDSTGRVRLLSQVTIMKTKTADPEVDAVPVLVIDRDQIPFFEGIKERDGKLVGIRLEAVAFEMPRDTTNAAQSDSDPADANMDLVDFVVSESMSPTTKWLSGAGLYANRAAVDDSAIDSYLLFRGIRPPTLKETYHLDVLLDGAVGAGKTVQTLPGTLNLDPFHRANPFRHAFHQKHPKGPKITRELTITFDSEQPVPDRLQGTYREEILGLTKSRLTLTGTIQLQRVSPVATLEGAQ